MVVATHANDGWSGERRNDGRSGGAANGGASMHASTSDDAQFNREPASKEMRSAGSSRRTPEGLYEESAIMRANALVSQITVVSVAEIEALITALQDLSGFLASEGTRVQRELAGYSRLSEEAMKTARIIGESVGRWKNAVDAGE